MINPEQATTLQTVHYKLLMTRKWLNTVATRKRVDYNLLLPFHLLLVKFTKFIATKRRSKCVFMVIAKAASRGVTSKGS